MNSELDNLKQQQIRRLEEEIERLRSGGEFVFVDTLYGAAKNTHAKLVAAAEAYRIAAMANISGCEVPEKQLFVDALNDLKRQEALSAGYDEYFERVIEVCDAPLGINSTSDDLDAALHNVIYVVLDDASIEPSSTRPLKNRKRALERNQRDIHKDELIDCCIRLKNDCRRLEIQLDDARCPRRRISFSSTSSPGASRPDVAHANSSDDRPKFSLHIDV